MPHRTEDNSTLGLAEDGLWHRLDNAATGFSLISGKRMSTVFRISCRLRRPVNLSRLQQAVTRVIRDFPAYRVSMRPGFFWYFWETNLAVPRVEKETAYPNGPLDFSKKGNFLFRVKAYYSRIAFEFHHTLTDGTGALFFAETVVFAYLASGAEGGQYFKPRIETDAGGYADEYRRFFQASVRRKELFESRVFSLPDKTVKPPAYYVITGIVPLEEVKIRAQGLDASLTEFFAAVYLYALMETQTAYYERRRIKIRPVSVLIPVNLRKIFRSDTRRNFFLYVAPRVDPRLGDYSFEEVVKQVHHYMQKEVNDKVMNQLMAQNIRRQWAFFNRLVPLFFKKIYVRLFNRYKEKRLYSGILTNLGRVEMPKGPQEEIERFDFIPNPQIFKNGAGIICYGDKIVINFGRIVEEPVLEKYFFRRLRRLGIPVKIDV